MVTGAVATFHERHQVGQTVSNEDAADRVAATHQLMPEPDAPEA